MTCPKCQSTNVNASVVNEVHLKNQHHGLMWWLLIGFWWVPVKWLFFTVPAILFAIFGHRKQKAINRQKTVCVCQSCGFRWNI